MEKSTVALHCLRCLIAFGVSFFFSARILGEGLTGMGGKSFENMFVADAALVFLGGIIIACIPRPLVWPVALAALPMPLLIQYLLIVGAAESNSFGNVLFLIAPTLIYFILLAPIAIRRFVDSLQIDDE